MATYTEALHDGANDAKLGFFSLSGSSEISSSLTGRPLKRRPKVEKIEIHNSNVHMYNSDDHKAKSTSNSHIRRRKAYRDPSESVIYSDRSSPRAHIRFRNAQASQIHTPSIMIPSSPILQLRGGAPGSYTLEPLPNDSDRDKSSGQEGTGNKDWNHSSYIEAKPAARDPEANFVETRDPWGTKLSEAQESNNAPPMMWDSAAFPEEKRDAWGQLITDDSGNKNTSDMHRDTSLDEATNEPNGWDASKVDGWERRDTTQQNSTLDNNAGRNGVQRHDRVWNTHRGINDVQNSHLGIENKITEHEVSRQDSGRGGNGKQKYHSTSSAAKGTNQKTGWIPAKNKGQQGSSLVAEAANSSGATVGAIDTAKEEKSGSDGIPKLRPLYSTSKAEIPRPGSAATEGPPSWNTRIRSASRNVDRAMQKPMHSPLGKENSMPGAWSPVLQPLTTNEAHPRPEKPLASSFKPIDFGYTFHTPPKPKPYWASWNASSRGPDQGSLEQEFSTPITQEADSIYTISPVTAQRANLTHQVRPMRASAYTHKLSTPKYMDTHEDPYAVFVFKFRDKAAIEQMTGKEIAEAEAEEKRRLAELSKEEIIEELIRAKASAKGVAHGEWNGKSTTWTVPRTNQANAWSSGGEAWASGNTSGVDVIKENGVANASWGKDPKGAGPWQTTRIATNGTRGADDGEGSTGLADNDQGRSWASNTPNQENNGSFGAGIVENNGGGGGWGNDNGNGGKDWNNAASDAEQNRSGGWGVNGENGAQGDSGPDIPQGSHVDEGQGGGGGESW